MSSIFIGVEWLATSAPVPTPPVGAVLVLDEHMGFKCYLGAGPVGSGDSIAPERSEDYDAQYIRKYGTKQPVEVAQAIFGRTMINEWLRRNMWDKVRRHYRYDGRNYMATGKVEEIN